MHGVEYNMGMAGWQVAGGAGRFNVRFKCLLLDHVWTAFTVALTASPAEARPVRCPAEDRVASALW